MGQITIYMDDKTEKSVRKKAKTEGLTVSKWIVKTIESEGRRTWPAHVLASFGTWDDVPDLETIRAGYGEDVPREKLD